MSERSQSSESPILKFDWTDPSLFIFNTTESFVKFIVLSVGLYKSLKFSMPSFSLDGIKGDRVGESKPESCDCLMVYLFKLSGVSYY